MFRRVHKFLSWTKRTLFEVLGIPSKDPAVEEVRSESTFETLSPEDQRYFVEMRLINNPDNDPIGHYTGRCGRCGSKRLWEEKGWYGCNDCGAAWATDLLPNLPDRITSFKDN